MTFMLHIYALFNLLFGHILHCQTHVNYKLKWHVIHSYDVTLNDFDFLVYALWFSCSQRLLTYFAFIYFDFERTHWGKFERHAQ